ncbi:alpha/beta fold hydrolase [Rhizohabitans arisaemae]|uniref:alpha/beta fold hydrolase n=1 Tax=Rhizohabitans arisaemae TaxID=2720610 RepID=UPI0024B1227E|nr:alpha/beta hydrolase [Rhizohabitans arisaemae]
MYLNVNGNRTHIEVLGERPGVPTIIAHHGAPGLGSMAEPRASFGRLADSYRVVVFDARGSGASDDNGPFTHEQWVADVEAIREWIGAEKIIMAGGSYGGFIAMEYAIAHPDRVSALVLRDTSADNANEEAARRNALESARVELDMAKFLRIMDGTVWDDADMKECWTEILPLYDHNYDPSLTAVRADATPYHYRTHNFAFSVNQLDYDLKPQLPSVTAPTLITVGRHDWVTPLACSETIAELIPNSTLAIFENSGHSPQIEEAELWDATVRDFLKNVLNT